jgi:hypothetical protein
MADGERPRDVGDVPPDRKTEEKPEGSDPDTADEWGPEPRTDEAAGQRPDRRASVPGTRVPDAPGPAEDREDPDLS